MVKNLTFLLNSATLVEKRSFPMSAAGRKVGKEGEGRMEGGVVEVTGSPGVWPGLGGQQEHGIPGRQEPRGVLAPSQPGGRLKQKIFLDEKNL